jgi:transposase
VFPGGAIARKGPHKVIFAPNLASLGMVKKLLQQRRRLGNVRPQQHRSGRKPGLVASHQHQLRARSDKKPDLTLKELPVATGLRCTLPAIHYVLVRLGLTSGTRRRWRREQSVGIRPGWSSSTHRARKRT